VVVRKEGNPPLVVKTEPRPLLEVAAKDVPEDARLNLVLPGASTDFELPMEEPVHLPSDLVAGVRVETPYHVQVFPVGPVEEDGRRRVVIEWRPPPLPAPDEPEVEGPKAGPILVVDGEGRPIANRPVRIIRDRSRGWGRTDENGVAISYAIGEVALVMLEGYIPRLVVPEKTGPVTLRYPDGGIRLRVTDEEGEPLDFAWCLDGIIGEGEGGEVTLRGAEAGEHRLVVGAKGHAARLVTVKVSEDSLREVAITLPRE
jgi:hypothetical protein